MILMQLVRVPEMFLAMLKLIFFDISEVWSITLLLNLVMIGEASCIFLELFRVMDFF
jgi:hypothetical protein